MGWAKFGATFSQTHLVTLVQAIKLALHGIKNVSGKIFWPASVLRTMNLFFSAEQVR
jgi:hypothetical protein